LIGVLRKGLERIKNQDQRKELERIKQ